MTSIAVIDTETSDLTDDSRVVELAAVHLPFPGYEVRSGCDSWLFSPGEGRTIAPAASAIHHLTDKDVAGRPAFDSGFWEMATGAADYVAAHNATFDRAVVERSVGPTGKLWLCSLKLSRALWPDAPGHGLQLLRYWLKLDNGESLNQHAHRAGYDAIVASWLMRVLLTRYGGDLAKMMEISTNPSLLSVCHFGKHAGMRWAEVPRDYLRWMLDKGGFDEDITYTARHYYDRGSAPPP